jgi:mono/diheme cytochrome c family protein
VLYPQHELLLSQGKSDVTNFQKLICVVTYAGFLGSVLSAQQAPAGRGGRGAGQATEERPGEEGAKLDPAAMDRGAALFRPACGFCHGNDARGGLAPDLARSLYVLDDNGGKELGEFLKLGRPDQGMPAFPALAADQLTDLAAFLHGVIIDARKRVPMDNNAIVVGDAKAGEAYFNGAGKCNSCHSPDRDLKGIGSKFDPAVLQDHMMNPRAARGGTPPPPPTVKVTLGSGETISGTLVTVNDFYVTLKDDSGNRRTFTRDNDVPRVAIVDPARAHLDMLLTFSDKNMHDLTAYLVTLK